MRKDACNGVMKVWLYAATSMALGAWASPLVYNAGKALAEVSSIKSTNGPLEYLAAVCRTADFPDFFRVTVGISAILLFLPWMEWIHAKQPSSLLETTGPWRLRLPEGARANTRGQRLLKNLRGPWHGIAGFLIMAGILLPLEITLVPAGYFSMVTPTGGIIPVALRILAGVIIPAAIMELFFRGISMGVFLRSMRPSVAIAMSATFFAIVLSVMPPTRLNVADPEAAGIGFELLQHSIVRFADWRNIICTLAPLLALGFVLAYARWRSASLWLPIGLSAGWLFTREMLARLCQGKTAPDPNHTIDAGMLFQQCVIPLTAIVLAGVMIHHLTTSSHDGNTSDS